MTPPPPPTDADLQTEYRVLGTAAAFAALVDRHAGWVHAAARRRVGGDEHLAADVTQAVFLLLAERPGQVRDPAALPGWLLRTTVHAAAHAVRSEARRRRRERLAAAGRPEVAPALADDPSPALAAVEQEVNRLNADDRTLVVLRFYQGRSLAEVGTALGISADAARKRLDRALARLRPRLAGAGASALLAGLPALSQIRPINPNPIRTVARATASRRAIDIVTGVCHMRTVHRVRLVAATAAVALSAVAGSVLLAQNTGAPPSPSTPGLAGIGPRPSERSPGPFGDTADARTIASQQVAVVISPDGKRLTGYSKRLGTWATADGAAFDREGIVLGTDVAVCRSGDRLYAYSGVTGTWATVDLPRGVNPSSVTGPGISTDAAAASVPGTIYGYSAATGTWAALETGGDPDAKWIVDPGGVTAHANGNVHFFGQPTGKWSPGF